MSDLEAALPQSLKRAAIWSGEELVLPHAQAVSAIKVATDSKIAILGIEAFEVRTDGLLTVDLADASGRIPFAGEWQAYVARLNAEALQWINEHRFGENHGYILTSASRREFEMLRRM